MQLVTQTKTIIARTQATVIAAMLGGVQLWNSGSRNLAVSLASTVVVVAVVVEIRERERPLSNSNI